MPHLDVDTYVVPSNGTHGASTLALDDEGEGLFDLANLGGLDEETVEESEPQLTVIDEANQEAEGILQQTQQEAERVLMEARMEAANILSEAQQKITILEENAYTQGFQAGEMAGKENMLASVGQSQSVLKAALSSRNEIIKNSESEVVELVISIAKKVVKTETKLNKEILVHVVRDALKRLGEQPEVHIHVHPDEVEILHNNLSQLKELVLNIVIEPDETVESGGCVIHSQAGSIDSQLKTQFENIEKTLLAVSK